MGKPGVRFPHSAPRGLSLSLPLSLSPSQSLFVFHFSRSSILINRAKERRGKKSFSCLENLRQIHSWVFLGEGVLWQDEWRGSGGVGS